MVVAVEDRIRRAATADHGYLVLLGDRRRPAGGGVIRRSQQQGVVILRDQAFGSRRGDRWPALIVGDIKAQPVAGPLEVDAALVVDPILAVEVPLLGHLAARGLATGEGEDRPDGNDGAHRRTDHGRSGRAGGRQRARRDQGREDKPGPPHVA